MLITTLGNNYLNFCFNFLLFILSYSDFSDRVFSMEITFPWQSYTLVKALLKIFKVNIQYCDKDSFQKLGVIIKESITDPKLKENADSKMRSLYSYNR